MGRGLKRYMPIFRALKKFRHKLGRGAKPSGWMGLSSATRSMRLLAGYWLPIFLGAFPRMMKFFMLV